MISNRNYFSNGLINIFIFHLTAYEMLLKEKQYFAIDTKSNIFKDLTASKLQNALSEAEFLDLTKSGMIPLEWLGGSGEPKLNLDISKIVEGMSGSDSIVVGIENDMLQLGIDLFLEPTSNNVSSSADVDRSRSAMKMIMEQVEAYRNFIKLTAQGESTVQSILEVLISSLDAGDATSNSENGDGDLEYNDREIVQEQEKEKDEEREKEVFQVGLCITILCNFL